MSQSVEHDHPCALEFLRKDCLNINQFFGKKIDCCLSLREFFDFVTDLSKLSKDEQIARLDMVGFSLSKDASTFLQYSVNF